MKIHGSALVVEDDEAWPGVYKRAALKVGLERIEITDTYEKAAVAIDKMRFAVAIVDIGLSVDDDRNVDGLHVMEKIRAVGDETSIIVVTGRIGDDVVDIINKSIIGFHAFYTVAKDKVTPDTLRTLIAGGLDKYKSTLGDDKKQLYAALRGDKSQLVWEDSILRGISLSSGAAELYRLIEGLLGRFAPLVPADPDGVQLLDGVALGAYWSRGSGEPVAVCFGPGKRVDAITAAAADSGNILGRYAVEDVVGRYSVPSVRGVVYRLAGKDRSDFG